MSTNFVSYGIGYLLSLIFPASLSKVAGVVFVVINYLVSGIRPTMSEMDDMFFPMPYIYSLSFLRYSTEALYLTEVKKYSQVYDVNSGLDLMGYAFKNFPRMAITIPLFGIIYRILACIALLILPPSSLVRRVVGKVTDYKAHIAKIKKLIARKKQRDHEQLSINY